MTRDEMVTYVLDRALISSEDTARVTQITLMLRQAHKRVVAENALVQRSTDLMLTADDPTVSLPSDWVRIRSLRLGTVVLRELSWQQFASLSGSYSQQVAYVMDGPDQVWVYPTPTTTSSDLELKYDAYPTDMTTGASTPEGLPDGYHEILPEMVLARVYMAEEELGLAAASKQEAFEMLNNLMTILNRRGGQFSTQIHIPGLGFNGGVDTALDSSVYPSGDLYPSETLYPT